MTTSDQDVHVHRSVSVPLSPERAFALFTARMGEFWPRGHSIGAVEQADVVVEPVVGGRWFERGIDGSECDWGRVHTWEPPARVVLIWQLDTEWRHDPAVETEVEVTFTGEQDGRTRVDLVHHHLERYGDEAAAMRRAFDGPNGWNAILTAYTDGAMPRG